MIATKSTLKNLKDRLHTNQYIRLGTKHKGDYVLKETIIYIEAYENYTWLHLKNGSTMLSCKSIGHYEEKFRDNSFIRVHRSYLINLSHVKSYEKKYRLVYLKGEIVLPISHRRSRSISKMIRNQEIKIPFQIAV
ncbi:LytR/AlgR family response regulator transcription factor [Kordia jejudonensis]|uniref:LytR/AlgR family response regulator transcription factor n=1 Tax=Kordia jejudonensis TaxID=1348245 RepID=UPI00069BA6EC|nr:LytTR family DNA-binding domain-containing protein [Kordia jejudonensis]